MRGWLLTDRLPPGDFGGYAAIVDYVRSSVLEFGRVPAWSSKWFAGSTYFMSSIKEYATLPLALLFEPIAAVKLMSALTRVVSAFLVYLLFARYLRAPVAGALAGWCYGFGACSAHLMRHLDVGFSAILFPLVLFAAVESVRTGRWLKWASLGALLGVQFCVNYVQAMVAWGFAAVVVFAAATVVRPVGSLAFRQVLGGAALAALTFCAFAASQVSWFAFDLANHALPLPIIREAMRSVLSTQSPIVILNRLNWLVDWLPSDLRLFAYGDPILGQFRYLGLVPVMTIACGWVLVERDGPLRRWFVAMLVSFIVPFWMSFGPGKMLDQIGRGCGSSGEQIATAQWLVFSAGALCLAVAASAPLWWRRGGRERISGVAMERLAAVGSLCLILTVSLFDVAARLLPPLQGLRSPGHFFDLVPLPFYLLFGLSVVAIDRRLQGRWRWWWIPLALLVVWDFWPSTALYFRGTEIAPLRQFRAHVRSLPADPSLRMLIPVEEFETGREPFLEESSLLGAEAPLGVAWSWLPWQANRQWPSFANESFRELVGARGLASPADGSTPLCSIGRFGYALLPTSMRMANPNWERLAANERFALWRGPEVGPMAFGARAYAVILAPLPDRESLPLPWSILETQALAATRAGSARHLVAVHDFVDPIRPGEGLAGLVEEASVVATLGELGSAVPGLAENGRRIFRPPPGARARVAWQREVRNVPGHPLVAASYRRPAAEEIAVAIDSGAEPALVVVSEAHHPWWTATVDGVPAPVLRAQQAFMGVLVPAGPHTVTLRLSRPAWVAAADGVTGLAWATALVAVAMACVRRFSWRRPT